MKQDAQKTIIKIKTKTTIWGGGVKVFGGKNVYLSCVEHSGLFHVVPLPHKVCFTIMKHVPKSWGPSVTPVGAGAGACTRSQHGVLIPNLGKQISPFKHRRTCAAGLKTLNGVEFKLSLRQRQMRSSLAAALSVHSEGHPPALVQYPLLFPNPIAAYCRPPAS